MADKSTEIIAHRGASADAPENTLDAFQLGLDQGADAIECDVRLSGDGELIVIHDETVERIAGVSGYVNKMRLAELKTLDAGSWKSPDWHEARIPALAEVLDLMPAERRIFIEIKVGLSALARLQNVLAASALPMSQIVLMEFDLDTVIAMKAAFPETEVLWLRDFPALRFPWSHKRAFDAIIRKTVYHGLDGINLQNIPQLNAGVVQSCRRHDLSCYCWTVDDPDRMTTLAEYGIDGIATNRPGRMREQLDLPI